MRYMFTDEEISNIKSMALLTFELASMDLYRKEQGLDKKQQRYVDRLEERMMQIVLLEENND